MTFRNRVDFRVKVSPLPRLLIQCRSITAPCDLEARNGTLYNHVFMRIGAVNYLNSKPLVCGLEGLAPDVRVTYDLPSRLADSLAAGRLDVALVPSVEFFRARPSDRFGRLRGLPRARAERETPFPRAAARSAERGARRRLANECGPNANSAGRVYGVRPRWEPLPIGSGVRNGGGCRAVDRRPSDCGKPPAPSPSFCEVWDLANDGLHGPGCRLCLRCGLPREAWMFRKWPSCW